MADSRAQVVALKGPNYATWKVQCRMVLMKYGVWKIVEGTEIAPDENNHVAMGKYNDRRDKALSTIVLALDTSLLYLLGSEPKDPVVVWKQLSDQFQAKTWANKLTLRRKLFGLRLSENQSVQDHTKSMIEIFDELAVIGYPVEEEDRVVQLLSSLPESYNMLVTALEASTEVPKLEIVTERLLNEERKIQEKRGTSRGFSGDALFVGAGGSNERKCFYCGKSGHIKRFCSEWKKKQENEEEKESKSPAVANFSYHRRNSKNKVDSDSSDDDECIALVSEVAEEKEKKWIMDSAATRHMSNDRKQFLGMKRLDKKKSVKVGDGSIVTSNFEGSIKLRIKAVNQVRKFKLRKVLYVPELKYNLFSVSQTAENGKIVQFDEKGAQIKDITSKETVGTATKKGKLYYVNIMPEEKVKRRSNRRNTYAKDMEKALLSVRENNFKEEIMERLSKVEEDKCKLNRRLNTVEEDINNNISQSYSVIKEDSQNIRMSSTMASYLKAKREEIWEDSDEDFQSEKDQEEESVEVEDEGLEYRFDCSKLIQEDYQDRKLSSACASSETEEEPSLFIGFQQEDSEDRDVDSVSELSDEHSFSASQMQCRSVDLSATNERESSTSVVQGSSDGRKGLKKKLRSLKKRCMKLFKTSS